MAIKLRGTHTPLNFVPETYNDMYKLLAQVYQEQLIELLRTSCPTRYIPVAESARQHKTMTQQAALIQFLQAFASNNKKLLAEESEQQGKTIQEAALTAPDPDMHPVWSDASSPTATTLLHQAGKRRRRSSMAFVDSAPLGSSAQGTSTGRCPSAAAVCADTTANNSIALGLTMPAAPQLVGAPGVSLGVYKGRARPAGRGWTEADALWEQAEQEQEGGGGNGEAMLPSSSHDTAEQDSEAQENNQGGRLLPDAGSNAWCADSSVWDPRRVEADVVGDAPRRQYTRAVEEVEEEEAGEEQLAMEPASWPPSLQASGQPAVSSFRQRLQLLLSQQRCAAPSECAASAAASWDD
ncbi:hypothetical protein V8C86DRAFT_2441260 [Haematococcus lacustris]